MPVRRVWPPAGHAPSRVTTVTLSVPEPLTVLALQWALGSLVRLYRCTKTATATEENWQFFTHNPLVEKTSKYVLKGLPNDTKLTCIEDELKLKDITVKQIRQMTKNYTDENNTHKSIEIPVWVLTVDNTEDTKQKLKDIRGLLHFKTTIEDLRNNRTVTQCLRCQGFGHKAQYCNLTRKCRLCAELHDTRDCPNRTLPLKCAGCGGGHQASSKECPKIQRQLNKLKTETIPDSKNKTEFPALPQLTETQKTEPKTTRQQPIVQTVTDKDNLTTLLPLLTSPQLQTLFKTIITLLNKITTNPDNLTKITNIMDTLSNFLN